MSKLFYLTSRHGDCGDVVMFHAVNGAGYVTDLSKAHKFTLEAAQIELGHDIKSLPLFVDEVDKVAIRSVDSQYIKEQEKREPFDSYVVKVDRQWNGNDIAFIKGRSHTFNYNDAESFTYDAAMREFVGTRNTILSKTYLDTICRPVIHRQQIDTRKMITGAGVKYKKPRKKKEGTGKTMMNCPKCGRIHWQFNPYDFDVCSNINCGNSNA
jgi:hypothetical protein